MNKLNKTKIKLYASIGVLLLVGTVAIGYGVKAYTDSNNPKVVVEGDYIEAQAVPELTPVEENLGSVTSPLMMGNQICANGDCIYHLQQTFQDATTTIVSIATPFLMATTTAGDVVVTPTAELVGGMGQTGATSTVELVRLTQTGVATSTYTVDCGASATNGANGPGTQAYAIISSDAVATSTKAVIENNISSSYGAQYGGGSVAKIMLGPKYPYLVCKVTSVYTGAFTETTNTFDGVATIRISRQRL